jgi:hypothetical protein
MESNGFTNIPDIDYEIMLHLDYESIINLGKTNKTFSELCTNEYFWFRMIERDFEGFNKHKPEDISYKKAYHKLHIRQSIDDILVNGELYMLHWIIDKYQPDFDYYEWVVKAAINGHLHILLWLMNIVDITRTECLDIAARYGHIHILKGLNDFGIKPNSLTAINACSNGHLNIAEWVKDQGIPPSQDWGNYASVNGQLHVLKWLKIQGVESSIEWANWAARYENINILDWLKEQGVYPLYYMAIWKNNSWIFFPPIIN